MFTTVLGKRRRHSQNAVGEVVHTLSDRGHDALAKVAQSAEKAGDRAVVLSERTRQEVPDVVGKTGQQLSDIAGRATETAGHARAGLDRASRRQRGRLRRRRSRLDIRRTDRAVAAQLAEASAGIAQESAELEKAVTGINQAICANRRAGARGRTKLIGGLLLGAGIMYHTDPEHGRERRANTTSVVNATVARLITTTRRDGPV